MVCYALTPYDFASLKTVRSWQRAVFLGYPWRWLQGRRSAQLSTVLAAGCAKIPW